MAQGRPCNVQQPLENAKRWCIDNVIWETIPRAEKPYGLGCYPPETTMTHLEVAPSQVPLLWGLQELRLREVKASMEIVESQDKVFTKMASLGKNIQPTNSFFM